MELHPLLSKMEGKDLERYMKECKEKLLDFLEDLGLSDSEALHLIDDIWLHILRDSSFIFLEHSDNLIFPAASLN